MTKLNDNRDRLAAKHHQNREASSPVLGLRRSHASVSPQVVADVFRPVPASVQPAASTLAALSNGSVSLTVAAGDRAAYTSVQPLRAQPQARLATQRDRTQGPEVPVPAMHPAIGRSVISPIIVLGGSEL